jgi:peptide/nickel transport system permease protein
LLKTILRKGLEGGVTLLGATLIIFLLTHLAPGDPVKVFLGPSSDVAISNTQAYDKRVAELRAEWGLDQPLITQYTTWMGNVLALDLGNSIHTGRPVRSEIAVRLPATLALAFAALGIQVALGLTLGMLSARKAGKSVDHVVRLCCVALASTPAFVIGLILLSVIAVSLGAYEISSEASLSRLWLPAVTLGFLGAPQIIRVMRANMLSELGQTYVLSALSRGLAPRLALRHAARNALVPSITMVALSLTSLVSGAVVIESIFSWPGLGKYALDSILLKDYPVIQGYALVMVALVVLIHLLVDVVHAAVDPRIRRTRNGNGKGGAAHIEKMA